MTGEDSSYRRSVRNTLLVLAAMLLTIVGALVIPPLVNPVHEQFAGAASVDSPYGFALGIRLNATQLTGTSGLAITAWLNSTSSQIENISAASRWPLGPQGLWTRICTNGWPLGVGIMAGYLTAENYSLGSLLPFPIPMAACPVYASQPQFFLLQPHGATAIVDLKGGLAQWTLTSTIIQESSRLSPARGGVYTAVAADEWGDLVVVHFRVSS